MRAGKESRERLSSSLHEVPVLMKGRLWQALGQRVSDVLSACTLDKLGERVGDVLRAGALQQLDGATNLASLLLKVTPP